MTSDAKTKWDSNSPANKSQEVQFFGIPTSRNQMQSSGADPFLMIKILSSFTDKAEWPLHGFGFVPSTVGITLKSQNYNTSV